MIKVISWCVSLLFSIQTLALELNKQEQPVELPLLTEVGNATFSVFFWDIYQSRLLTPTGSFTGFHHESFFEITYLKDISNEDLLSRTVDQWQHLNIPIQQYQAFNKRLLVIWPDIVAGDKLLLWNKATGSEFYFNDHFIGVIEEAEFAELFLSIWLSPKTSQPELRAQLLGEKS